MRHEPARNVSTRGRVPSSRATRAAARDAVVPDRRLAVVPEFQREFQRAARELGGVRRWKRHPRQTRGRRRLVRSRSSAELRRRAPVADVRRQQPRGARGRVRRAHPTPA